MTFYLTYGIAPVTLLLALLTFSIRGRWAKAVHLSLGHEELAQVVSDCRRYYIGSWVSGLLQGLGYCSLGMLCTFLLPGAERPAIRVFNMYWLPGMVWAIPHSWTGLMLASIRNRFIVLGSEPAPPFVAYLRDRTEELREEVVGPPDTSRVAPMQRGIERLVRSVPERSIYGFWDPTDRRTGLNFSPLISAGSRWKQNVSALCRVQRRSFLTCRPSQRASPGNRTSFPAARILPEKHCC